MKKTAKSSLAAKITYFFPVQLLIVHLKYNLTLLAFWLVLFAFVLRLWGNDFGIPYLFLDPEYMGRVDFFSYLILGLSCGGFFMAYQIASYIVNSRRFPFLASLSRPFLKYTINNSFIPIIFLITYSIQNYRFQDANEDISQTDIFLNLSGFFIGAAALYILSLTYFFTVSKDIFKIFGISTQSNPNKKGRTKRFLTDNEWKRIPKKWRDVHTHQVDTYLAHPFEIQRARDTGHYDPIIVEEVFRQNHLSAAVFEIGVVLVILVLGFFRDLSFVMIPAGASIFLSLTMLLMLASAFHTWTKGWSVTLFIVIIVGFNALTGFDFFWRRNLAFGLDYTAKQAVIPDSMLFDHARQIQIDNDIRAGITRLSNWRNQAWKGDADRPTLVFLNVSGGGLKSALWTFQVLQEAQRLTNNHLLHNIHLITGSSGGMIGAAYMRELFLQSQRDKRINVTDARYAKQIGQDLLNPVTFSLAVSDAFIRLQHVTIGKHRYIRDRGYEFEKALHENTEYMLDKTIQDYAIPENLGKAPMMIFSPTVINDGRRILISSQPISFLTFTPVKMGTVLRTIPEDIEFSRFFKDQGAPSLRLASAIRMNASFPYILPSVSLPSKPTLEVMDAGFRDNYGIKTSLRYLFHFRNWIQANTERVVFLQIRENHKSYDLKTQQKNTWFEQLTSPLGNVYENMFRIQDYHHDELLMYAEDWYKGKIEFIELDVNPRHQSDDQLISMSFHLTSLEKKRIHAAIKRPENQAALKRLEKLLK